MSSISGVIYIGVTNDLIKRVEQHKDEIRDGFTKKYKCKKLIYYEHFRNIKDAIKREKELKGWKRCKKFGLINVQNPLHHDLYEEIKN